MFVAKLIDGEWWYPRKEPKIEGSQAIIHEETLKQVFDQDSYKEFIKKDLLNELVKILYENNLVEFEEKRSPASDCLKITCTIKLWPKEDK